MNDFITWWFESHYIWSLLVTPELMCVYSIYKGWYWWATLSAIAVLSREALLELIRSN